MKKNKKKASGKRIALRVLCTLLGVVLVVLLGGTVYATYLMNQIGRVDGSEERLSQEELDALQADETVAADDTSPTVDAEDVTWDEAEKLETGDHIINILLIGQDARPGESRARSDSMILCTFNTEKNTITLTSFLRDLYVQIPGYQDNKMNAAYAAGGMELLDETLEVNFGVVVDGNIEVNFDGFTNVINTLGGVDIELRSDEANYINRSCPDSTKLTSGLQHLDGDQALLYARIRYLDADADFSRTNRQRKVLTALVEEFREAKLTTILGLVNDLVPLVTTDLSNSDIVSYATQFFPMLASCEIISQRIPADGTYTLPTIRGMSCVLADMDAARQLLAETIAD